MSEGTSNDHTLAGPDNDAVGHDPAAEDLDLLTVQEAKTRVLEELNTSRSFVAELEADESRAAELPEARARLANLESTASRLENPTVVPPDPYPTRRR